jgi:probable F420-dependent oxidoreductase
VKIGVVFPQTEIGRDPAVIRDYAQAVEAMGYTHILAFDSVVGANPDRPGGWTSQYDYRHAFHEPFVLFGFLAGVTRSIELVTGVVILPQRQTALVAKQAAEVDVLSGGRLRLGIGVGWNPVEFEALGEHIENRGKRVEEQLEVMRLLWTRELVTYQGQWHRVPDAGIRPLPVQQPIPVWMGGEAEAVLRRAARLADAADAWPLLGVGDFDEFNRELLSGRPTVEPRVTSVPVRLPLPPAARQGSIYENQLGSTRSYFQKPV